MLVLPFTTYDLLSTFLGWVCLTGALCLFCRYRWMVKGDLSFYVVYIERGDGSGVVWLGWPAAIPFPHAVDRAGSELRVHLPHLLGRG